MNIKNQQKLAKKSLENHEKMYNWTTPLFILCKDVTSLSNQLLINGSLFYITKSKTRKKEGKKILLNKHMLKL